MTKSRDIAKILGVTEDNNPNSSRILFLDESLDSARITDIADTTSPSLTVYDSVNELPVQSLVSGTQAYVKSNKRLYVTLNNAYYNIATVNLTPTVTLDPSGTIVLSDSGQPSAIVTMIATDSDGRDADLTFAVESDGNMLGRATLTQDSSVFTINPLTADSGATTGTFTLTFKANDGINIGTATKDFSLTFATSVVDSSAETILLVKATGSGLENDAITYKNSSDVTTGFTETGDPTAATFSPYRSGGYSTNFDGTGDYLSIDLGANGGPDGDCTFEFWVYYKNGSTNSGFFHLSSTSGGFNSSNNAYGVGKQSNTFRFYKGSSGAVVGATAHADYDNTWVHLALVRSSGTVTLYINGVADANTGTNNNDNSNKRYLAIGGYYSTSFLTPSYIRDFRYVKGTAVYTSNFTPPTEPLTAISGTQFLMGSLPYFADQSTNNHTFTVNGDTRTLPYGPYDYSPWTADDVGGSVYLDGTGDDLTTASSSDFAYGTGDFTWEAWIYVTGAKANHYLLDHGSNGGTMNIANTKIRYYNSTIGISSALYTTGGTITYNAWHHIAFVRSSGTTTIYVDGAVGSSAADTHNYGTQAVTVGDYGSGGYNFLGYIADLRIVKGTAIYTSAFTPPTAPLSHTGSGTSLLMNNKSDANIYDAAAGNVLVSIDDLYGNGVQSNTTPRKFTTSSSMFFSSDGSYLIVPDTELLGFGTGDFTWELWIWSNGMIPSYVLEFGTGGNSGIHYPTSQGHLSYYNSTVGTGSTLYTTGFSTFDSSTWMHIAVSRVSGTTYLFKDGTLTTSASDSHNYGTSNALYIGTYGASLGTLGFYGRMQDIRITKGKGRYTSSFTAPTAEFEL